MLGLHHKYLFDLVYGLIPHSTLFEKLLTYIETQLELQEEGSVSQAVYK